MISTRYAIPVCILLVLALIPTTIHSYIDAKVNDGKSVNTIAVTLNNFTSVPSQRNEYWGQYTFGSEDWFERVYLSGQDREAILFVARSYDQKRLYHHPELALSYGHNFTNKSISALPGHPEIPVHLLRNNDNSMIVAYILLYDNTFIENPIKHQFNDSLRLLFNARKPMTLFYASQSELAPNAQFEQLDIASLLSIAIQNFQSQTTK